MIDDIQSDAEERMEKSLDALAQNFNKIRTGRAHPSILDGIRIDYCGRGMVTVHGTKGDVMGMPRVRRAVFLGRLMVSP